MSFGFRIGTFNIIPSFAITTLMIGCMGILPYYARYGLSGEQPRTKDDFERYEEQKGAWESGNIYLQSKLQERNAGREDLEAKWRAGFKKLQ